MYPPLRGRSPSRKASYPHIAAPTVPPTMDPPRRRRVLLPLLALAAVFCFLFFSSSHELFALPPGLRAPLSRANIAALMRGRVDEIHGLLYFVVHKPEQMLGPQDAAALDPAKPIAMTVYEAGDAEAWPDWTARVKTMNTEMPLVVFSKTYCPYSKRAKELLKGYDLEPAPQIIEVDLRDDGDLIKAILTRLTSRSTFPNVILLGKSIGGSDQLVELHKEGKLKAVLEEAGLKVQADIKIPEAQM